MIRCLALNPCMDKLVSCPAFSIDAANRVKPIRSDLGGKAVNVARVLTALGAKTCLYALDFAGSPVENAMTREGIPHTLIAQSGALRVNLKILDEEKNAVIEVNEVGEPTDARALESLLAAFLSDCQQGDWGVLSGSLAPGMDKALYKELCLALHEKGCRAAVDCDGEALALALTAAPDLIKPNRAEFARLTGISDASKWPEAMRTLNREKSVGLICLSLGRDGAMLCSADGLCRCAAADVPVLSATGAGDSMLAGLLYALEQGKSAAEALCLASAAAGASVMRPGTLLCQREDAMRILPGLKAEPI